VQADPDPYHTPQRGDVAGPAMTETFVVMGPRLRGDDSGWVRAQSLACLAVDFFTGSKAGTQAYKR
jgi:hypothetical protein